MQTPAILSTQDLDQLVGGLIRSFADYDQMLFDMVRHLRTGATVRADLLAMFADPPQPAPARVIDDISKPKEEIRTKLIESIVRDLGGTEHLADIQKLFDATEEPRELRDIVAHWRLRPTGPATIIATSFVAELDLPFRATKLLEKYRTPPPKPKWQDTPFHDRSVTITTAHLIGAAQTMESIILTLRSITARVAASYVPLLAEQAKKSAAHSHPSNPD